MSRPTALVTGASMGIGYELAKCFGAGGYDLVLVARDRQRLDERATELASAYGVSTTVIAQDLASPGAAETVMQQVRSRGIAIDALVNNAGFASHGHFARAETNTQLGMIQVNVAALTHLTRLCLPDMVGRKRGLILNVGSTAGFLPGPLMAVYYATKGFVLLFSEALANELRGTGVTVTVLCPSHTRTGFHARANIGPMWMLGFGMADAAAVAKAGYEGAMRGKTIVIPGLKNRLMLFLARFGSRSLVVRVIRILQQRRLPGGVE